MLNPLIHKLPSDTLRYTYCVLCFIDSLPNVDGEHVELGKDEAFGYFCILQCVKDALKFEYERSQPVQLLPFEKPGFPELFRKISRIKQPYFKAKLFSELSNALDICSSE